MTFKREMAPGVDRSTWPSMRDIILLRNFLLKRIPMELVVIIFDQAEYWAHITCRSHKPTSVSSPLQGHLAPNPATYSAREFARGPPRVRGYLLCSPPLGVQTARTPVLASLVPLSLHKYFVSGSQSQHRWLPPWTKHPVRMVIFEKVCGGISHGCWKHCEVSILRNPSEKDDSPNSNVLQRAPAKGGQRKKARVFSMLPNLRKGSVANTNQRLILQKLSWLTHRTSIKWRHDGEHENAYLEDESPTVTDFMTTLEVGDSIGLWAPAGCGYPEFVDEVRMHIFWAV